MATNNNELSLTEVQNRISEIIKTMSKAEMIKLLKGLEKWQQSKLINKREHHRKNTSIYAFGEMDNLTFRDFIKNLSAGGLFIETETPLIVDKELFIRFLHPDSGNLTKITGKIVRVDSKGIGVKFDKPLVHIV